MAKCIKCGSSFIAKKRIKLKDADICGKCFEALGFDPKMGVYTGPTYSWDDIKDGYDAMLDRKIEAANIKEAASIGVSYAQYRQLNNIGATDMETKLVAKICAILKDEGRDPDLIEVSLGDNHDALLMVGGTVFIRLKADEGVKWIVFENESSDKIRIGGPARLNSLAGRIIQAYDSVM